jgi:transcriptional regulator GlxA family with amidase domain
MVKPQTRLVVMLAYDGANLIDLSGPIQAFDSACRLHGRGDERPYEIIVASAAGGTVVTAPGLPVTTRSLASLGDDFIDTLIIPGGSVNGEPVVLPDLVSWVVERIATSRRICSVCTGAFTLAATGLLDGRRATTHWNSAARLRLRHPRVQVDPDPIFIKDGPIWTSAGVTAGIDLALALIEEDLGHDLALRTARQLVMFVKRPGGQSQFSVPLASQLSGDGSFVELHAWIADHLAGDLRVERLAEQAGMSPRTFARVYKSRVGRTPAKTVEAMRLEAACRALEATDMPIKRIAAQVGYGDEQRLRRAFQRDLGVSPMEYRQRFSGHHDFAPSPPDISRPTATALRATIDDGSSQITAHAGT